MNRENIIELANQSGGGLESDYINVSALERFAELVAKDERDWCLAEIEKGIWFDLTTEEVLDSIAAAIIARGKKGKV
jgi:hypothetical protein